MVVDGNHRIMAYQYTKAKGFVAELSGFVKLMNEFRDICLRYK